MEDLFYCGEEVIAIGTSGKSPFVPPNRYRTQTFRRFKTHDEMPASPDPDTIYRVEYGWNHQMDPLLGKKISDSIRFGEHLNLYIRDDVVYAGSNDSGCIHVGNWILSREMITEDTEEVLIEDED
jgi:hypothetical protein